jgi:hypothetical protein
MKYNPSIVRSYWRMNKLPEPVAELQFHPVRKWRFDWAWEDERVALEVQGGLFVHGGHNRGGYLLKEHEKRNAAAIHGWRILYCQPKELCTLQMVETIRAALRWTQEKGVDGK